MNHQHASLTHIIQPFKGAKITTTAYYSNTFRNWTRVNSIEGVGVMNILNAPDSLQKGYNIMRGLADGAVDVQGAERYFYSAGVQTQANYQFTRRNIIHDFQIGLRLHADQADRYATRYGFTMTNGTMVQTSGGVIGNQENQIRRAQALAGFASYTLTHKKFKLVPGIRFESIGLHFKNYGTADNARLGNKLLEAENNLLVVLPGMGMQYELNRYANLFAGIHKGFSPPGMPAVNSVGDQAKPEFSTNVELGYRYDNAGLYVQTVAFLTQYRNILGSDNISGGGMGTGNMYNAGNARIAGLEALVQYNLLHKASSKKHKVPVGVSYTYTHARFLEAFVNAGGDWGSGGIVKNDIIPFITPHMLSVNAGYEQARWNATVFARYTGLTRVKPSHGELIVPSATASLNSINAIPAFLIIDIAANYKLNNTITLFTQCGNITNSKAIVAHLPQGYRPNMPLSVTLGVKANF
jgi:Fe(3+) dicitrate transport protein